ncbi:hypothetical protein GTX14_23630 [Streptomyces sp. SID4944]|nr:hypothetical protein [Streptomyces sp. SID4944]
METFLTACGISPAVQRLYTDAYRRVTATRPLRPAPPRARRNDIRTIVEARSERHELTGTAAAIARQLPAEALEEILFTAITREAQRNGSDLPDGWAASSPYQDTGVDISMRTAAGRRMVIQVKNHRHPEPPPHAPGPGAPPSRPGSSPSGRWFGPRLAALARDQAEAWRARDYHREVAAVLAAPARSRAPAGAGPVVASRRAPPRVARRAATASSLFCPASRRDASVRTTHAL